MDLTEGQKIKDEHGTFIYVPEKSVTGGTQLPPLLVHESLADSPRRAKSIQGHVGSWADNKQCESRTGFPRVLKGLQGLPVCLKKKPTDIFVRVLPKNPS